MNFRTEIIQLLSKIPSLSEFDKEELDKLLSVPPNSQMGDYAFPCFKLGKNPKEEADKLKGLLEKKTKLPNFLQKITVAGPYLNFYISQKVIAEQTLTNIFEQKKEFGKQNIGKNKKVVIDFSHPNIAKPFGIGHLRSTVIGNSLYKTFQIL